MIRVIKCCDSFSWDYFDPNVKTEYYSRANYCCTVKNCKKKKVNGRCSLQTIRFTKEEGKCLDMKEKDKCTICKRIPSSLEKHHLDPKKRKGKTIPVCVDCADQVHQLFTNKELGREYNTLEKLLASPKIQKWVEWIKNKKRFGICMKTKKRR